MKKMRNLDDLAFVIENKPLILKTPTGRNGEHARIFPFENFLKLSIEELIAYFVKGNLIYDEDPTGANTLVMKTFESREEAMEIYRRV